MATKRREAYIWVTWLKGLLIGDQSCVFPSWTKSHFQNLDKVISDFDFTTWRISHTRLLREVAKERTAAGEIVTVERQNKLTYRIAGATIGGQPDLLAVSTDGEKVTVWEAKTGKTRESDKAQTMIYMYLVPRAIPEFKDKVIDGVVVYKDRRITIPAESVTDEDFELNLLYWIEVLASDAAPPTIPSATECRFCDMPSSECPDRVEWGLEDTAA